MTPPAFPDPRGRTIVTATQGRHGRRNRGKLMNFIELLEGGGLIVICALLIAFATIRSRRSGGEWPRGIIPTNAMVLLIVATGFFGLVAFIDSFLT